MTHCRRAIDQIRQERGREPTAAEIAVLLGIVERYTAAKENDIIKEIFLHNKTMAQVSRERGLSFDSVRQIKEKGLRRLWMGKAKRELLEKFDIAEAGLFQGGLNNYREHNYTSVVEHLAEKRLEAEKRYKRHLRKIEEMHRKRLFQISEKPEKVKSCVCSICSSRNLTKIISAIFVISF